MRRKAQISDGEAAVMFTNALSVKLRGSHAAKATGMWQLVDLRGHAPLRRTTHSTSPSSPATGEAEELGEALGTGWALASEWAAEWQSLLPLRGRGVAVRCRWRSSCRGSGSRCWRWRPTCRGLDCNHHRRTCFEEPDRGIGRLRRLIGVKPEVIQCAPANRVRVLVLRKRFTVPGNGIWRLSNSPRRAAITLILEVPSFAQPGC